MPPTETPRRTLQGERLARLLQVLIGAAAILGLVYVLRSVLTPLFLAFLIAYVLDPLVDRLEARRIPRWLGIIVVMLAVLGGLVAFLLVIIPGIVEDVVRVAKLVPGALQNLSRSLDPWLRARGVAIPHNIEEAMTRFGGQIQDAAPAAIGSASDVLRTAVGSTIDVLSGIATGLITLVFAFYLLLDFDLIVKNAGELVPLRHRDLVYGVAREIDQTLAQWIRGQLTVMLVLGLLYSIGFSLVGIRLAVGIGILAGLLSFIPYVGTVTGLVLAVLMALLDWHGPVPLLLVFTVVAVVQTLDGVLITPRIVGGKVGLGPAWVLIALMAGGSLFGFLGVLIAVPTAAVLKILVGRTLTWYRKTALYGPLAGDPAVEAAASAPAPYQPLADALGAGVANVEAVPEPKPATDAKPDESEGA